MNGPFGTDGESTQERAEILRDGIPYVRGWAQARFAALTLAEELQALGLECGFPYLRADVNMNGDGFIRLDLITAETARCLVTLLTLGLCTELERLPAVEPVPGQSAPTA